MAELPDTISIAIEVSGIEEFERAVSIARENLMGAMHPGTGIAGAIVGAMERSGMSIQDFEQHFESGWNFMGIPLTATHDLYSNSCIITCGKCGDEVMRMPLEEFRAGPSAFPYLRDHVLKVLKDSITEHQRKTNCLDHLPWIIEPPQPSVRKIRFRSKKP